MQCIRPLITLFILLLANNSCFAQDTTTVNYTDIYNGKAKIIGELGKPFGTIVTVKGILVDYFSKRGDSGPNLIVQMINDSAVQEFIQIPISSYSERKDRDPIDSAEYGATYMFEVYETATYIGLVREIYTRPQKKPPVRQPASPDSLVEIFVPGYAPQGSGFHLQNRLMAIEGEKIEPIIWSPEQFIGRNAFLTGTAENDGDTAVLAQPSWKIKLVNCKKWGDSIAGKPAEVYGIFKKTAQKGIYTMETGWAQPANLEDQLGQVVKLRGTAISMNGYWWFSYRGIDMYVENMEKMPGWSVDNHFRKMEITGLLVQEELPRIDQITLKRDRDKKMYYVLKNASWAPIDGLLLPELKYDKYGIKY